ncbi:P-loop containing nucleoside triphosphate hydrolase protein [Panus rudis PR-1116 ss-1]|nr:P-loop containing nucleoside triphosphate hydrolase protein [Panus rudis PR-1116 ss-1]
MGRNKSKRPEVPLRSKLKKDPGVPRLPSLKVRNAEKQRLQHPPVPARTDPDAVMASEPTLSSLAALAAATSSNSSVDNDTPSSTQTREKFQTKEQLRRHFVKTLHKVIDESDIVLLVLDARDPEGCRSRLVEEEVRRRESEGKRLIFVLNKVDLIPPSNAQAWLKYLRHSTPTLPFRSVSSTNSSTISTSTSPALIRLLKAYRPSGKQSITVGVVGYPNVGKSSLVNALKRVKVCPVAAQPGHTTTLQTVHLERGIKIVDSPGVIFDDDNEMDVNKLTKGERKASASLKLRNVMKVEDVDDPIEVVEEILNRVDPATIQKIYNLPLSPDGQPQTNFGSTLEFLTMLALTSGRLLKGGTPDILGTARQVLNDWNHQKIPYYSTPPAIHPSMIPSIVAAGPSGEAVIAPGAENVGQARIITEFSKPFEMEGLFGMADQGAFANKNEDEMAIEYEQPVDMPMDEAANEMESDSPNRSRKRSRSPSPTLSAAPTNAPSQRGRSPPVRAPKRLRRSRADEPIAPATLASMESANPLNRRALKRAQKQARKAGRVRTGGGIGTGPINTSAGGGGMEVDDDGPGGIGMGLSGTFFAGLNTTEVI